MQNSVYFNILPKTAYGQQAVVITVPHPAVSRTGNLEAKIWAAPTSTETLDAAISKLIELRESVKPGKMSELEFIAKHFPAPLSAASALQAQSEVTDDDVEDVIGRFKTLQGAAYFASSAEMAGGSALHHLVNKLGEALGIK